MNREVTMEEGAMLEKDLPREPGPDVVRRAAVDIGTNSIKLLVADVRGTQIFPIVERSEQTRLGRGFYETSRLQPQAIQLTADVVGRFVIEARELGSSAPRLFATSAARDALNASDLLNAIHAACDLTPEILSGDQEADWVFRGVATDPRLAGGPLLILDVGGGSTEFILGRGQTRFHQNSYPLGTVRLLERLRLKDPPGREALEACRAFLRTFFAEQIIADLRPALAQMNRGAVRLIGTGGTATILARIRAGLTEFNRGKIEEVTLRLHEIQAETERQWTMTLEERKAIPGMPAKRADVILTGVAIYEAVMEVLQFGEFQVSTRGLRYGAVLAN